MQITAHDGGSFDAHLVLPPTGRGPGLVLLQEIFGVNDWLRSVADSWAARGFVVACPDLFWRTEPGIQLTDQTDAEWQRAFQLYQATDQELAVGDAAATVAALRRHPACTGRVGCLGFCLGGKLAYLMTAGGHVDASVGYYGAGIEDVLDRACSISTPLLLHFATEDEYSPPGALQAIHTALDEDPLVTIHDYAGQDHAFARDGGAHYDAACAELAHLRSADFLQRHLVAAVPDDLSAL